MDKNTKKDIKLGFFILIGLLVFVSILYYIGKQSQLFSADIEISSEFGNVSGLQVGNNVRLSGIKIGVVSNLEIISDTTVRVHMFIDEDAAKFIKKNSFAIIESEGLMGNRIVTIRAGTEDSRIIEEGDVIRSKNPVGIDAAIETFMTTAEESKILIEQFVDITERIKKGEGALGMVVSDTSLENEVEFFVKNLRSTSREAEIIAGNFREMSDQIQHGEGIASKILYDSSLAKKTERIVDSVYLISRNLSQASEEIQAFSEKLNSDEGALDKLLTDSLVARDVEVTLDNIRQSSEELEGAIHTVENSWILNMFSGNKKNKKSK